MLKHAYLIMLHEYTLVFERLVQLLDDASNDFYIHIDKNAARIGKKEIDEIKKIPRKSKIFIYRKYRVFWGTNSIMDTQKYLLTNSVNRGGVQLLPLFVRV